MMQTDAPSYEWGQHVQAAADLFNDGSYPEQPVDGLLASRGEAGEIVQVGKHVESGMAIYMVKFAAGKVVGCFEPELLPLQPVQPEGGAQ
jgi:nitrogen fixation protein NifZ